MPRFLFFSMQVSPCSGLLHRLVRLTIVTRGERLHKITALVALRIPCGAAPPAYSRRILLLPTSSRSRRDASRADATAPAASCWSLAAALISVMRPCLTGFATYLTDTMTSNPCCATRHRPDGVTPPEGHLRPSVSPYRLPTLTFGTGLLGSGFERVSAVSAIGWEYDCFCSWLIACSFCGHTRGRRTNA
jgi:hypothetical protein